MANMRVIEIHAELIRGELLEDGHLEDQEWGGRMVLHLLTVSWLFYIVTVFVIVD
jgi:hypothetical protein